MRAQRVVSIFLMLLFLGLGTSCRRQSDTFVIALSDNIQTIDPIGAPTVDAASERVRVLMFNSLVRKNEKFDYVPELASNFQRSEDDLTYTFTLHDGVKFHDGRQVTSADAKYTLDTLLTSNFGKSASFFEGSGANKQPYVKSVEAPDPLTLILRLSRPGLGDKILANFVTVGIIPKDSAATQKDHPLGSGPFKFVRYDPSQQVLDLVANKDYWEGAPHIDTLRVRVISDANALQAELRSGRVDLAPLPTNLSPDAFVSLGKDPNLQVKQFSGSNLNLLTFNTQSAPLDNVSVRQAIAYAIDRESIIRELLLGQAKIAHSILPEESWAYTPGVKYSYDPEKARKLLDEAGFRASGGEGMRFPKPVVFKISSSSVAAREYAGVIQNYLKQVGIPVSIETAELNTLRDQLRLGQFQITYGQWVGGNQDPIFYQDLFATSEIPTQDRASRNRSRYSNKELDTILNEATSTSDHEKALRLYARAQDIVSRDVPVLPLWYQANMVVAKKSVGNIQVDGSGDWGFVRKLTVNNK